MNKAGHLAPNIHMLIFYIYEDHSRAKRKVIVIWTDHFANSLAVSPLKRFVIAVTHLFGRVHIPQKF